MPLKAAARVIGGFTRVIGTDAAKPEERDIRDSDARVDITGEDEKRVLEAIRFR